MGYESDGTIALLREVGFARLAAYDGCACSSVKVREFEIDVGCRKGSGGHVGRQIWPDFYGTIVRVYSRTMDISDADCALVAEEVRKQVAEATSDAQIAVRLCSYQDDDEGRCSYCHEPRAERWGYFCAKHLTPESRDPWGIRIEPAIAMEARQGGDGETRLHPKDDNAGRQASPMTSRSPIETNNVVERLREEADLCRNDGADDIAALLEEAASENQSLSDRIDVLEADKAELERICKEQTEVVAELEDELRARTQNTPDSQRGGA